MDVTFLHLGMYPVSFDMNSPIHRKEEKPGINYTLAARYKAVMVSLGVLLSTLRGS